MKRIFVLFAFILTATFAQAQSSQTPAPNAERAHTQALRMQKQLGLTEEQTAKVKTIMLARYDAVAAVNADASKTQEQKDAEVAQIRNEKEKEIMAVFTPEQLAKYNELKAQREARKKTTGQQSNDE